MTVFNIRTVRLQSGDQFRDVKEVDLEPLELGGQRYVPIPESPEAALTLTRLSSGLMLELEFDVRLVGPCVRCLSDAGLDVSVHDRQYQATAPPADDDELRTPYLQDDRLDLSAWARDAVALALPDQIHCRPDCAGLCPVCGRDLNVEPHEHEDEGGDERCEDRPGEHRGRPFAVRVPPACPRDRERTARGGSPTCRRGGVTRRRRSI
jgi:uncharacterized protein